MPGRVVATRPAEGAGGPEAEGEGAVAANVEPTSGGESRAPLAGAAAEAASGATGAGTAILLCAPGAAVPEWARRLGVRVLPTTALDAGSDDRGARGDGPSPTTPAVMEVLAGAGYVLLDAETPGFVRMARRLHALDASLQVVAVAPPDAFTAVRRGLLYAPGLGEVWVAAPGEVSSALGDRAAGVTRQRRRFERTRARLERERHTASPQRAERALVSDAYLASLLDVLPDAVCSVDAAGRVLSANAAAEQWFGGPGARPLVGNRLAAAFGLDAVSPGEETALLARAEQVGAVSVAFRDASGMAGAGDLRAVRVGARGGAVPDVWAVVLQDVTAQRATTDRLRATAEALEAQTAALEAQTVALRARTADAEAARAAAEIERARATEANTSKSQFLANMSHELRTPLNAIGGYVQLLELGLHGPVTEAQQGALARVQAAQRRLLSLINDVLNYAKLEGGRVEYDLRAVDVRDVVGDVVPLVASQIASKGLALDVRPPDGPCAVWADREKLGQVLLNLLSNAIKFTDARHPDTGIAGRVTVDVTTRRNAPDAADDHAREHATVCLTVSDTGCGIPHDRQVAVFEPFVQVATGYARPGEGTGLGLSISRDLARGMGGELTVESTPGGGSTFTLTLPRA